VGEFGGRGWTGAGTVANDYFGGEADGGGGKGGGGEGGVMEMVEDTWRVNLLVEVDDFGEK